ncbi:MAG: ORF6N domain-containing protein [Candidatus Wallbacteria bacterium]|nr:ORF6N domain-containing protein [Candidatus Wallbacteria bacterium]
MNNENIAVEIPEAFLEQRIFLIRGKKVLLDRDLAMLYGVKTKVLNQAVHRNIERFPADFMFQLNNDEMKNWKSQFVTSKSLRLGLRKCPFAFTELGIAMLSSVLMSSRAIQVNISIVRTFVRLREIMSTHKELREQIELLEQKYDRQFMVVFDAIKKLLAQPPGSRRKIGFTP